MVVDRLTYRFRNPVLGDIVSFSVPDNPLWEIPRASKRIVASGGETVHIRGGIVFGQNSGAAL